MGWREHLDSLVNGIGYSVTGNGSNSAFQLGGDASSPGNSKYYGTNASGTKGYHALPSGGAVLLQVDKTADETQTTGTTLTDITDMTLAVTSGKKYQFSVFLKTENAIAGNGMQVAVVCPTANLTAVALLPRATTANINIGTSTSGGTMSVASTGSGGVVYTTITGKFTANASTVFKVQGATNSGGNLKIYAEGSAISLTEY